MRNVLGMMRGGTVGTSALLVFAYVREAERSS